MQKQRLGFSKGTLEPQRYPEAPMEARCISSNKRKAPSAVGDKELHRMERRREIQALTIVVPFCFFCISAMGQAAARALAQSTASEPKAKLTASK